MNEVLGAVVLVAFVNAVVFGPLAAWLAVERGRDPAPWFVVGIVAGPFAAIAVGLGPRKVGHTFKACIECQEPIASGATTCPFCGSDLIAAEAAEWRTRASKTTPTDG